jgi:hypothetical protein
MKFNLYLSSNQAYAMVSLVRVYMAQVEISLFWVFMQRRLVVTNISEHPISPMFKRQTVKED